MYNIKTMNKISPAGLMHFTSGEFLYGDKVEKPQAIIVRSASLHDIKFEPTVKAIARAGAGVNNIPIEKCSEAGIVVFNTPGANANGVKELVIGAMIMASRNFIDAVDWAKTLKGSGADVAKLVEKGKEKFTGPELMGKKLGVIGLGAVGGLVANAAQALGMEVYGFDAYLSVEAAWGISSAIHRAVSTKEIYEKCDYITVHVPLTPETRGTFNKESIALMKRGVHLFNFARGELAVSEDIKVGLESGQVASYTVDFPCDELLGVKGVTSVPHLGASTPESEDNCAEMAAHELIGFLKTGNVKNSVNFPNAEMPFSADKRITVIHRNVPNMISQITSCFASENINIENMIDKSRKELAYTIIDVAGDAVEKVVERLRVVDGVIRVTVII